MCRLLLVLTVMVAVISGCATHAFTSGHIVLKDSDTTVDVRFTKNDRNLIGEYYTKTQTKNKSKKRKNLPPGLAKRGDQLPPGLAKRDKLPPGLQGDPLPDRLENTLSPLPSGHIRLRIGQDIVLMNSRTRVVMDILYSVVD